MDRKNNKKLLNVSDIFDEFGIKPALVYHWVRCKKFPIIKIGKKILIKRAEFDSFLNSHFVPGESQ